MRFDIVGVAGAGHIAATWLAATRRGDLVRLTEGYRVRLGREGSFGVVARDDGSAVAGCLVTAHARASETAHLSALGVVPERWGEGLGAATLETAVREATARGYGRCELHVQASNERARALYERAGWQLVGPGGPHPEGPQVVYGI